MTGGPRPTPSRPSQLKMRLMSDYLITYPEDDATVRDFAAYADIPEDEARDHIDGFAYAMQALADLCSGDAPVGRTLPQWMKSRPKEDIKVNWEKEGF